MPFDRTLDIAHDGVGLIGMAVNDQPARTFRNPDPHYEHDKAKTGAGQVSKSPTQIDIDPVGIEQHDRTGGAEGGAEPEAAVDHQIGPSAIARRHQFLDRRIDSRVFTADASAGQETKESVA